jgi:aminoglycoside 6'-N-acetyltransferase
MDSWSSAEPGCASPYAFRAAMHGDLPLLDRWLRTAEVARWWGDAGEQWLLLSQDLADPRMVMRIVEYRGRPFGYTQDYDVASWPQEHLAHLPRRTRAIDAFIGEPDMLGRGHGGLFLKQLADRLIGAGAPLLAIDPDLDNLRAQRAYEKAGFRRHSVCRSAHGPVVLMLFGQEDSLGRGSG